MRTVSIKLKDMAIANIQLGFVGENNATQVIFDSKEIFDDNPYAVQLLVVTPPESTSYEVTTARIGDNVIWNVSELDTAFEGTGSIQLVFTDGSQVIKTYNADTTVLESQVPSGTAPATALNWIQDAEAWAKGTRGGRAVEDDDPTYQNNSKYYSDKIVNMASDSEAWAKGTRDGEAVESDDPAYQNNSKYYAESIAETASDSEAYAAGTRGGEAVDEDDPAYHNNAAYYNDQAALEKAAAQAAAETASAAYNVNLLAANYDATKLYAVGEYVIYSGGLYRCISAITTAEAWTSGHWTSVTVGKDTSALKSAFSGRNYAPLATIAGSVNTDGTSRNSTTIDGTYKRTDYIEVRQGDIVYYNNIKAISSNVIVSVYDVSKTFDSSLSIVGNGASVEMSGKVVIQNDGFVRFSGTNGSLATGYFKIAATDDELATIGKAADAGAVRSVINDDFTNETKGLYEQQYNKTTVTPTWESGQIYQRNGTIGSSTKHIRTGYIPVYGNLPIEISAPDNIKLIVLKYSSNTSVSSFTEVVRGYTVGKQRAYVDTKYFRLCACYTDGSDISADDGANIVISRYANNEKNEVNFAVQQLDKVLDKQTASTTWTQGQVRSTDGSIITSDKHIHSGYVKVNAGSSFRIDFPQSLKIAVIQFDMKAAAGYEEALTTENETGYYVYNEQEFGYIRVDVAYADGADILPAEGANVTISIYDGINDTEELNILVLGNSFSMDSFAYLPPILNEALPNHMINYGVAYTGSADIQDHIDFYEESTKYTMYYEWSHKVGAWKHWTSTGSLDRGRTLADIMDLRNWDIIYVQPATNVTDPQYVIDNVITPGRELLRILQSIAGKPFAYLMGEWLGTDSDGDHGDHVFGLIAEAMQQTLDALGIDGVIPIGAAIQDARTNDTLQALGTTGNMLYDGQHMQSGIPVLIATLTIAQYILRMVGMRCGVYGESFIPTTANCITINAWHEGTPTPMTHGESVGVTTDNVRAAQEIASIAIRNPYTIVDCSDVIIETPEVST